MRAAICFAAILLGAAPALAKECRMPELPPGARASLPPGCDKLLQKDAAEERLRGKDGFIDLGNGTSVRIGGRVRVEVGTRR
ncbi:hypothetical protein [Microvirga roseola]|uniref:hypothetical protein n=1 Tax=Microvirga roseola TaxID=2883126 RepID=UPI001E32495E|nr:hypothetical protein [Microvirga roseola]